MIGTFRPALRTVHATACSSPKLPAPTKMPCTRSRRNKSAQVSASWSDCTQPARVCRSVGTTTRTPVFFSASSVSPRTLAASSALNDPRLAGMKPRVVSFKGKPM